MRNVVIGVILGVLLVVGLLKISTPLIAQQNRLQLHGRLNEGEHHLYLTCDTGNGTMVYTVEGYGAYSQIHVGIAVLPNGCAKK